MDVGRLQAPVAVLDLETDAQARPVAVLLVAQVVRVDEDVLAAVVRRDEPYPRTSSNRTIRPVTTTATPTPATFHSDQRKPSACPRRTATARRPGAPPGGVSACRSRGAGTDARMRRLLKWDRGLFARVAATRWPAADEMLPRLSRAANHGGCGWRSPPAGGGGRQTGRRAALRGLGSLALASPTVNLVGKRAVRRPRPLLDGVPLIRRLRRQPFTTSFPSGHAASAAAFAAGVVLEEPQLGPVIAPLAASGGVLPRVHRRALPGRRAGRRARSAPARRWRCAALAAGAPDGVRPAVGRRPRCSTARA